MLGGSWWQPGRFPLPQQFWAHGHVHPGLSSLHAHLSSMQFHCCNVLAGEMGTYWAKGALEMGEDTKRVVPSEKASSRAVPWALLPGSMDCYKVCKGLLPLHPSGREKGVPACCGPGKEEEHRGHLGQDGALPTHGAATAVSGLGVLAQRGWAGGGCAGGCAGEGGLRAVFQRW